MQEVFQLKELRYPQKEGKSKLAAIVWWNWILLQKTIGQDKLAKTNQHEPAGRPTEPVLQHVKARRVAKKVICFILHEMRQS